MKKVVPNNNPFKHESSFQLREPILVSGSTSLCLWREFAIYCNQGHVMIQSFYLQMKFVSHFVYLIVLVRFAGVELMSKLVASIFGQLSASQLIIHVL